MKDLNSIGINSEYLPVDLFNNLKQQIQLLKGKKSQQQGLAGNIKEEWNITEAVPLIENYVLNFVNKNPLHIDYLSSEIKKFKNKDRIPLLKLTEFWVNFQKKHEFNPIHKHSGLFSFIIFIQIPYDLEKELKEGPGSLSNCNVTSCLQFHVTTMLGRPFEQNVFVDKSYEGGIYFFNAETKHCVYPFYTSDDYRITVSGNIGWDN